MKSIVLVTMLFFTVALAAGCESKVTYQPPILPVKLVIDSRGNVSIENDLSIVTPVGKFSVGAKYSLIRDDNTLLVIIRYRNQGDTGFDSIYRIESGKDEFVAVVNGTTVIEIAERQVLIDITDGSVRYIEFKPASGFVPEKSRFWKSWPLGYQPFALASWAYDDEVIDKWYGIGFLVFIIRLILAAILLFFDLCIILFLGIGVVIHSVAGLSARNIYFGLLGIIDILIVLGIIVLKSPDHERDFVDWIVIVVMAVLLAPFILIFSPVLIILYFLGNDLF